MIHKHPKRTNKKIKGSKKAFIFGPFVGELYWEAYRFAPYAISLKKRFPYYKLIVFTRPTRFDLYGNYADIFVPLKIDSNKHKGKKFTITNYYLEEYKYLCNYIKKKYANIYFIVDHCAPQINGFMYKVKWQFPRKYMLYDFNPRLNNNKIIDNLYGELDNIVLVNNELISLENYNVINMSDFSESIKPYLDDSSTWVGCLIYLLKKCKFVISNFDDILAKFSLLCGTTVITVNESYTNDSIYLMNPLSTIVIKSDTVEEGVADYEDYFL